MVSAILLAGGYATRLRPLSLTKPKALFPVLGKPIIEYILEGLQRAQIEDIHFSLRVMYSKINDYIASKGIKAKIAVESEPLGDAGALKYVNSLNRLDDTILVVYGDIYSEVDFNDFLKFHDEHECPITIMGTKVEDPRRYGVLVTNDDDKLEEIIEKPKNPVSDIVNAGVYAFKKSVLDKIDGPSISKNVLPKALNSMCISVYKYDGIWADIGVPRDYMRLNIELLSKKFPKGFISTEAKVSEKAELTPPYYISEGSIVTENSYIDSNTVLGRRVRVDMGSYVGESIIMDDVEIGMSSYLSGVIVADKCKIGKWNRISEGTILGEEVLTYDGIMCNRDTIILPNKEVTESIYKEGRIIL
ncbi:mannose-1-phosphate guanylyltransferase [Candidatus Acidianus copahuensis]|uniref:Mannose-1-phosphate guanylyltransferase n=1 Tax=Candidatus Acidianus copahuensis TaxID=1160895 RepID=A0A031LMV1_9CREN|nr:NDP-sugar synthase [Candidatus Acidianus copahuensis]EZQ06973.1 mannose-1-phosphate guanylyltransferase [Candidatus Acidianus copahuensis]